MSWRARSDDPNSRVVLVERHELLTEAAAAPLTNRLPWLVELCRDRRVVDIGCVDHHIATNETATWLHRAVARSAAFCLGVDIEREGVAAMREAGYEAIVHDVCTGLGPVEAFGAFDVVVAGEVIEHLAAPQALFEFAHNALVPGGLLVLTTPNPYAPHRSRSGQLGLTWENVDHVMYAFPAGIAELGERTGFRLDEYRTVMVRPLRRELRRCLMALALARRDHWRDRRRDHRRDRDRPPRSADASISPALEMYVNPFELALIAATRSRRFIGETSLYVLRKVAE